MRYHLALWASLFMLLVAATPARGAPSLPTSWWVNANGSTGFLTYRVDPATQKVRGTLLGTPVEGYLVGRHLVLHRYPQHRNQIWDGWIMARSLRAATGVSYSRDTILAGTFSVNGAQVFPFFGVERGKSAGLPSAGCKSSLGGQAKIVAGTLHGLRWELPCANRAAACRARVQRPVKQTRLGGDAKRLYSVSLRFRGVVEQQSYAGGTKSGFWYRGGRSANGAYNIYKLQISNPPQTYYLNAGKAGIRRCWKIDYIRTLKIRGGAKITLSADAQDGALISNAGAKGRPIVIPGVAPFPRPYNGQFIQMDVLSVN